MKIKAHVIPFLVIVILLFTFFIIGKSYFFSNQSDQSQTAILSVDQMEKEGIPEISGTLFSNTPFNNSVLENKVIIVNFWASWCSPCIEEFPSLVKLINEFPDDIHLVAISEDTSVDDIVAFLKSFPNLTAKNISILIDNDHALMKKFSVTKLPESFITDKEHKLVKKIVGSINWYTPDSIEYIKSVINNK